MRMSSRRDQKLVGMNENDGRRALESFAVGQRPIRVVDENVMDKFWQELAKWRGNNVVEAEMPRVPVDVVVSLSVDCAVK